MENDKEDEKRLLDLLRQSNENCETMNKRLISTVQEMEQMLNLKDQQLKDLRIENIGLLKENNSVKVNSEDLQH